MKVMKARVADDVQLENVLSGPEDRETLLFLHGLGANLRQFEPQQQFFAQEYWVLLVSLRGHGNSSGPAQPTLADYTVGRLACDLQALLSYLHIGQVHFVGNSLGGLVGYELLELDAKRIASLSTW
jgi:pimeloyl-ACP methyl ester carboxylesterase